MLKENYLFLINSFFLGALIADTPSFTFVADDVNGRLKLYRLYKFYIKLFCDCGYTYY